MYVKDFPRRLIGNTPLVRLGFAERYFDFGGKLFAKLESKNPAGSIKDRAALFMLRDAEQRGLLKEGSLVIEPTSGNTGIALALLGAASGYRVRIFMPASMSAERAALMRLYGAEVTLTPAESGMTGAVEAAKSCAREENGFVPGQFENPACVRAHFVTAEEIRRALRGNVGAVVAGIGTGGTITGVGRALKACGEVLTLGVEPAESRVLSGGPKGSHGIQGIGAGFRPGILDLSVVDRLVAVGTDEALEAARFLSGKGLSAGISSGAALAAAVKNKELLSGRNTVLIFPDGGERYLSILG